MYAISSNHTSYGGKVNHRAFAIMPVASVILRAYAGQLPPPWGRGGVHG